MVLAAADAEMKTKGRQKLSHADVKRMPQAENILIIYESRGRHE